MSSASQFAAIDWDGRALDIEYQWIADDDPASPLMVFLHEGLGSVSMWKDFPERLCQKLGCRGLLYSRPGYGQSSPRTSDENWQPDFMHRQAYEVLPALLDDLGIGCEKSPVWLLGHSDGGSIALLYAARFIEQVDGLIVLSPHIMVEDISIKNIELARSAYLETNLRERLAKYHIDPDSAFWGWNNIWLQAEFRGWSIENEISTIRCPVLVVQGIDDEYGTLEQVYGLSRRLKQVEVVELPDCGHSPHRDQSDKLIEISDRFFQEKCKKLRQMFNQVR